MYVIIFQPQFTISVITVANFWEMHFKRVQPRVRSFLVPGCLKLPFNNYFPVPGTSRSRLINNRGNKLYAYESLLTL